MFYLWGPGRLWISDLGVIAPCLEEASCYPDTEKARALAQKFNLSHCFLLPLPFFVLWRFPFKNIPGAGASEPLLNAFKTTFPESAWQPTTFLLGNLVKNEDFYELSHLRLTKSKCLEEKSNYLYCLTNSILVGSLNKPLRLLTSKSVEKQEKGLKILFGYS